MLTKRVQNIKEGIDGRPANWYSDVFDLIFPNLDREKANKCKACEMKKKEKEEKDEDSD
jgi:Lon-like ATP-dependent protease